MLSFVMTVIGTGIVNLFIENFPDSQSSLNGWLKVMRENHFKHFNDLKQTFGSADYVKPYTVFNISGNKYRLISLMTYAAATVGVKQVLTHAEYDKEKWKR